METKPNASLQKLLKALSRLYDRKQELFCYISPYPLESDSPDPQPGPVPHPIPPPEYVLILSTQKIIEKNLTMVSLDEFIDKINMINPGDSFMIVFEGIA